LKRFEHIIQRARDHQGGQLRLEEMMPTVRSTRALAQTQDNRWLAQMTRCVFQAGFVWRVVDHKWDGFEEVFFGFPPDKIVMLSPDQIDRFAQNPRIIRNRQKVLGVQANAQFILDITQEHGSVGKFISRWPTHDLIGLFATMKKRGSRLGGMTGQRVLRNMGKDTFIITGDVVRCLQRSGLDIGNNPSSKRELGLIQNTFNVWHEESGLPYSHISRICALSL
jgi:3-methyladenine DNA glycosylase Tag|tara:strand:+ start:78 stop:746 length:669 start_codon:yes stop_codon:yes gene_type:complete